VLPVGFRGAKPPGADEILAIKTVSFFRPPEAERIFIMNG